MKVQQKDSYKIRYLILPDFVFANKELTYMSAKIYAFIHNYSAPRFFFSNKKLAILFNCSESAVTKAISQLKEEKFIDTQFNGRKRYIVDLMQYLRVVKKSESASDNSPSLVEATASDNSPSLVEASTADPNKNSNKNNLGKFGENEIEVNRKGIMLNPETGIPYTGSQLKAMRKSQGWGTGGGRGYPQTFPSYQEKSGRVQKGGHDVRDLY